MEKDFQKEIMLSLVEYVCVCYPDKNEQLKDDAFTIAPFVTGGRCGNKTDKHETAEDIRVLHRPMKLWRDHNKWYVEYFQGQTMQTNEYIFLNSALDFIKHEIESFWESSELTKT